MRATTATLLIVLTTITATVLVGAGARDAARACPAHAACGTVRLPAPIIVSNGHTGYRITSTGRATRIPVAPSRYPRNTIWFPGTGTWYRIARGHLVVGRGAEPLWRSRMRIAARRLGLVAAGPAGVAFQHDHRLYVAPLGGSERPVARRELPLGWTTAGLYTYSYPRRALLLRANGGTILKTIARRPREYEYDLATRSLYFLSRGMLMGADGARTWRLAFLRALGMSSDTWLQPLGGGLIELLDDARLTVIRRDGSVFASTAVRRLDGISSFLAIAPRADAVAFTGTTGSSTRRAATVDLLRRGAHATVVLHREPGSFAGCGQWASLQWRGSWLLYSNSSGSLAAINTAGEHRTVELGGLVRELFHDRAGLNMRWSR